MRVGEKPRKVALKQAAAAVGQTSLMYAYERAFEKRGRKVGQLLLTHEDFESRERYNNARNTIEALLSRGIVPIINENDPVATEEIRGGEEGDARARHGVGEHSAADLDDDPPELPGKEQRFAVRLGFRLHTTGVSGAPPGRKGTMESPPR